MKHIIDIFLQLGMVVERNPCVRGKMSDIAMRRPKATACMKHSFQSGIKERICISKKTGSKAKVNTSQQPYFFGLIHRYWLNLVLEKKYSRVEIGRKILEVALHRIFLENAVEPPGKYG